MAADSLSNLFGPQETGGRNREGRSLRYMMKSSSAVVHSGPEGSVVFLGNAQIQRILFQTLEVIVLFCRWLCCFVGKISREPRAPFVRHCLIDHWPVLKSIESIIFQRCNCNHQCFWTGPCHGTQGWPFFPVRLGIARLVAYALVQHVLCIKGMF
jgi:hypothetical protein